MNKIVLIKLFFVLTIFSVYGQTAPPLGSMGNFTVLAGTHITSTGNTVIYDNIGAGTSINGFTFSTPPGPGTLSPSGAHPVAPSAAYTTAMADLTTAYNNL